jgi:hypothetical protein
MLVQSSLVPGVSSQIETEAGAKTLVPGGKGGKREEGGWKREEGRRKREEGRGKREKGRKKYQKP